MLKTTLQEEIALYEGRCTGHQGGRPHWDVGAHQFLLHLQRPPRLSCLACKRPSCAREALLRLRVALSTKGQLKSYELPYHCNVCRSIASAFVTLPSRASRYRCKVALVHHACRYGLFCSCQNKHVTGVLASEQESNIHSLFSPQAAVRHQLAALQEPCLQHSRTSNAPLILVLHHCNLE